MAKRKKKKKSSKTPLLVKSGVKDYAHAIGFRFGSEAMAVLEQEVQRLIDVAAARAEYNNRVTITAGDV